jgi:hypothetical protein
MTFMIFIAFFLLTFSLGYVVTLWLGLPKTQPLPMLPPCGTNGDI